MRILAVLVLIAGTLGLTNPAQAMPIITCAIIDTTGTDGCQDGIDNNDFIPGGNGNFMNFTVNLESFFGYSDWMLAAKHPGNDVLDATWIFTGLTGDWLMVLKGGPGFAGWLVRTPAGFVTWENTAGKPGLSHTTFYTRNGTTTIPEPGTLGLLGLGLAGLGLARRNRKKA